MEVDTDKFKLLTHDDLENMIKQLRRAKSEIAGELKHAAIVRLDHLETMIREYKYHIQDAIVITKKEKGERNE